MPSLITGDYRGQLSMAAINGAVTHDVNANKRISRREKSNQEVNEALVLSGAYLLTPLWQTGFTLPYKFNTHRNGNFEESSNGMGDIKAQVAYEFLPEYGYNPWKPRGFIFLEQSIPLSNSTYDANKPLRTDSLGNGFFSTALGMSFVKTIGQFDYLFMAEIHQGYKKSFSLPSQNITVTPRLGSSAMFGLGLSPYNGDLRIGATLLYSSEGKKKIEGDTNNVSERAEFLEIGVSASYLIFDSLSATLSYRDQSFFGVANNTTLAKSATFSMIHFFEL